MDEEAQKMVALKKAYAEIILNTGKEAAARIMVSERKALRFQRDLVATKDEALRMLVRLKQMLDSKAAEAELTSLNQQRKIDELEAQLQEAEDVIADLRVELRKVEGELDKVKSDRVQPLNGIIVGEHGSFGVNSTSVMPSLSSSGLITVTISDVDNMPINEVLDNKCCNARQAEQSSVSNSDLYPHSSDIASIIMKRKEPELYRNGCTQRIRALERNLLDGKLSPSGSVDNDNSLGNNESTMKVSKNNSLKNQKTEMVKNGSRLEVKKLAKVRTLRKKKKTRFGKVKSSARSHHSQLTKTTVISHFKRNSVNGNYRLREGEHVMYSVEDANMDKTETLNGEQNLQHRKGHHNDEVMVIQKGKRQRKMRNGENTDYSFSCPHQPTKPSQPSSVLSRCRTFEYLVNGGIKFGEDGSSPMEKDTKIKSLPRLDLGMTVIKSDMDPISGSSSVTPSVKAINKLEQINDAAGLMIEPESVKQETDVTENSTSSSPSPALNIDLTKLPSTNCELKSEQLIQSPSHPDSNRLLKYTFQRKRKKEAANNSDEIADNNSTKKKTTECVAPDSHKSCLINESSRDNRRLVQVARQLISLSGKRWR